MPSLSRTATRPVPRPASLIFTLFGDFVEEGSIPIAALLRLIKGMGISEAAVRQAVSRMARAGWLGSERRGGLSVYSLTSRGRDRVRELRPRIYGPLVEWDGRWRILTYAIAEGARAGRDGLRKDLAVLGWAPLSASTWISPRDSLAAAREAARGNGVLDAVDTFAGEYAGPRSDRELLERCWDLPAIASAYRAFLAQYEPRCAREKASRALSDGEAFAERLLLVHEYRKFTYVDPGLPSALLPAHWPGTLAAALFRRYYALISAKAERFFIELVTAAQPNRLRS